jgi:hypothetical protein
MRIGFLALFVALLVAACGHDKRPIVVNTPAPQETIVTPVRNGETPVVATPRAPGRRPSIPMRS